MKASWMALWCLVFAPAIAHAADMCRAIALRDVGAVEDPSSVIPKGSYQDSVTQYNVDKATKVDSFCSHGGYCYPVHVTINGQRYEAMKLVNCKIAARSSEDGDTVSYEIDMIRSANSPATLRYDDIDNQLLSLGLCSACAGTAADWYIQQPQSRCGILTKQALEGNPVSREALVNDFPTYCDWNYQAPQPITQPSASAGGHPSFSCGLARNPDEKLICSDPTLSNLDAQLGTLWSSVLRSAPIQNQPALKQSQAAWLRQRRDYVARDTINAIQRLTDLYRARIAQLAAYEPQPATNDLQRWVGTWRAQDGRNAAMQITESGGQLHVKGHTEIPYMGTVNVGDVSGSARPSGSMIVFTDGACVIHARLSGNTLISEDNSSCGGINATFYGTFKRSR